MGHRAAGRGQIVPGTVKHTCSYLHVRIMEGQHFRHGLGCIDLHLPMRLQERFLEAGSPCTVESQTVSGLELLELIYAYRGKDRC